MIDAGTDMDRTAGDGNDGIIREIELQSMLYDFYGSLLNRNQQEVMALYHEDNLSLSEIASELGMTRQAVHYTLKKAEKALKGYEERLKLVETYESNRRLADKALELIDRSSMREEDKAAVAGIIRKLSD